MSEHTLVSTAVTAALEAGKEILEIYRTDFSVEHKEDTSPLTKADQTGHEIISRHLDQTSIPVLSEEGTSTAFEHRKTWNPLWIVDPLDGTKEFIKRNGEFTVNIALVQDHTPVLGVIFVPATNTLYIGSPELGARRWVNPTQTSDFELDAVLHSSVQLPEQAKRSGPFTIVGSRSHPSPELEAYVQDKERELGEVQFVSAGSSLKFCLMAEGQADVYPRLGPTMEWDTAAGQAIALAAGCRVRVWDTEDLHNPWFVVQNCA
jgi:3'(2'), 5'-bisphosphate nucleotidase